MKIKPMIEGKARKEEGHPDQRAASQNTDLHNTDDRYILSSGRTAQSVQKRFIRHLLANIIQIDKSGPLDRLEIAGTDAVRALVAPRKNPMQYISELRKLNGDDCIFSFDVDEARVSEKGSAPVYYYLPINTRVKWRKTIEGAKNG